MTRFHQTLCASKTLCALTALAALAQLATASAAAQSSQEIRRLEGLSFFDTGPLRIRDQFLLSAGLLTLDPVSADVLDPGKWQIDVVGSVTNAFAHSCLHMGAALTRLGAADVFGLDSQLRLSGMLGYEHALGSTWSVVLQGTVSQSPFQELDIDALDKVAFLMDLGFKKGLGERNVFFFAVSENIVNFDNTPDVGIHVGWTKLIL